MCMCGARRRGVFCFAWSGTDRPKPLQGGQVLIEMGDGFDTAEIIFEVEMFVGSVSVFVRQTKTDEHAWHFKGVVHLRDERNRAAFANKDGFFVEAFLKRSLRSLENWRVIGRRPRFAGA